MLATRASTLARRAGVRSLRSTAPRRAGNKTAGGIVEADNAAWTMKAMHWSAYSMLLLPVAFVAPPVSQPIDFVLGFTMPVHFHIGMNFVISDYVPKGARPAARMLQLAATSITFLGLLRLNTTGSGATNAIRSLWHIPEERRA